MCRERHRVHVQRAEEAVTLQTDGASSSPNPLPLLFRSACGAMEQAAAPAEITTMPPAPQNEDWDQWEVLDMQKFKCPTTERVWYSTDDSRWFMPEADGIRSICGNWAEEFV